MAGVGEQALDHHQPLDCVSKPALEVIRDEIHNLVLLLVLLEDVFALANVEDQLFLQDLELAVLIAHVLHQRQH